MAKPALALEERGEAVTSRAVAQAAHISREHRLHLAPTMRNGHAESEALLSTLHYSSSCTSDNTPAAENSACTEAAEQAPASVDAPTAAPAPPTAAPAPPKDEPLGTASPSVCLAASHQLFWRWSADAWQCAACGT